MGEKLLEINLFGACVVRKAGGHGFEILGTKHRGMFALLATAPFGRRTRTYLQDLLWGTSCFDSGRQSLRRALSDIKIQMGADFDRLLTVNNTEITLNLPLVHFIGRPGGNEFLEGLDVRDVLFEEWLRGIRINPEQVHGLFSATSQPPPPAILPTIVVLPFRAITPDPQNAILGDWLAEEIARSLSRSNLLEVISHLSSRELSRTVIDLERVRDRLKVDYCVIGSLRVIDNTVILGVDCLDAASGRIIWTRQFTGKIAEFLTENSPPVVEVVQTVGRTVASEAVRHVRGRHVADLEDHQLLVAGVGLMHQQKLVSFARSRELIEEAIRRAPRAAEARAWLGEWHVMSVFNGWTTDAARDTQIALDCAARALDIDPENAFCLTIDGVVHNNLKQDLGIAQQRFDAALDLNPNESMAWLCSGILDAYRDDGASAVRRVEKAIRLSPMDPFGYFFDSLAASAHLAAQDYSNALKFADRSLAKNDRHPSTLRARICALHYLGRAAEARATGLALLQRQPGFTLADYVKSHPAAKFQLGKNVTQALAAAGIP